MVKKYVVSTPSELHKALSNEGWEGEHLSEMVEKISPDMRNPGEVRVWDGAGGFVTITNKALIERRSKSK